METSKMDAKETAMRTTTIELRLIPVISVLLFTGMAAAASAETDSRLASELRVSESAYGANAALELTAADRVSTDVFEALTDVEHAPAAARSGERQKTSSDNSRAPNTDFWFYTADVSLFADRDGDGYYYGIDLLFDADTYYSVADVYAVVYLSLEGGPWREYASTETFPIDGASGDDEYVIVTELLSGYPAGSYEMLIELYDAWDDSFVADIGPESTSALAFLPLEDSERDAPAIATRVVTIRQGGGGAADWLVLLALGLLAAARLRVRRQPVLAKQPRRGP
jgi:hypothetical protein